MRHILGVDIGGTFTDFSLIDDAGEITLWKEATTPTDPGVAIRNGLAALAEARGAWTMIQTPEEMPMDAQIVANGYMRHVDYPDGGLELPAPAVMFDEQAGDPPRAPDFAEHTGQILGELGYDESQVEKMRQAGVVV